MKEAPRLKSQEEARKAALDLIAKSFADTALAEKFIGSQVKAVVDRVRSGAIESATFRLIDGELNVEMAEKAGADIDVTSLVLAWDRHGLPSLELSPKNVANDDLKNDAQKS